MYHLKKQKNNNAMPIYEISIIDVLIFFTTKESEE